MTKNVIIAACLFGAGAVILGAFGAHILKKILTPESLLVYKTGIEYQFYHTFALLFTGIFARYTSRMLTKIAAWLFSLGIIFFSGSLYLLAVSSSLELESFNPILGPMTPLGGLMFIGGWVALLIAATKYKGRPNSSGS